MPIRNQLLVFLLSASVFASVLQAQDRPSNADPSVRRDAILQAANRVCREALGEPGAQRPGNPRGTSFEKATDPDILCGCTVRHMRMGLDSAKVHAYDRPGVAQLFEDTYMACLLDGIIDDFPGYCDALFTRFYGEEILTGPFQTDISRFCGCAKAGLHRLRPDTMIETMKRAETDIQMYRDTGRLEDHGDGSFTSIFAGCGIVDLKQRLIESRASGITPPASP